jgi:DNA-binding NarL/FixJ family response regulator
MALTEQTKKHQVFLVDDHPIVRYGISRILNGEQDMQVCGEAPDADMALAALLKLPVDIVIVDISLKGADGLHLTKTIRARHRALPILILSMHNEAIYARRALRNGANGYIMKEETSAKLVAAIRYVLDGGIFLSERIKDQVLADVSRRRKPKKSIIDVLSDREREVFLRMSRGLPTRVIADELGVSVKTVDTHRSRIKSKLNVPTIQKLTVLAAEWAEREGSLPRISD